MSKKRSGACADNYQKRKLPKIKSTQGKLKLNERNKHKNGQSEKEQKFKGKGNQILKISGGNLGKRKQKTETKTN